MRVEQRHAEVALDAQLHQGGVEGKSLLYSGGMVAQVASNHVLAGRAGHVPLGVVDDPVAEPVRQGADTVGAGELGHEGVARVHRDGEVADERLKELLPRLVGRALDDGAEGGHLIGRGRARVVHQTTSRQLAFSARQSGVTTATRAASNRRGFPVEGRRIHESKVILPEGGHEMSVQPMPEKCGFGMSLALAVSSGSLARAGGRGPDSGINAVLQIHLRPRNPGNLPRPGRSAGRTLVGVVELVCVILVLIPRTAALGARCCRCWSSAAPHLHASDGPGDSDRRSGDARERRRPAVRAGAGGGVRVGRGAVLSLAGIAVADKDSLVTAHSELSSKMVRSLSQ